jgi:hypothetical protein
MRNWVVRRTAKLEWLAESGLPTIVEQYLNAVKSVLRRPNQDLLGELKKKPRNQWGVVAVRIDGFRKSSRSFSR